MSNRNGGRQHLIKSKRILLSEIATRFFRQRNQPD